MGVQNELRKYMGQKLVNALRAIHKFIYSGAEIEAVEMMKKQMMNQKNFRLVYLKEDKRIQRGW